MDIIYTTRKELILSNVPDENVELNLDDDKIAIMNPENDLVWYIYELIDFDNVVGICTVGKKLSTEYYG